MLKTNKITVVEIYASYEYSFREKRLIFFQNLPIMWQNLRSLTAKINTGANYDK